MSGTALALPTDEEINALADAARDLGPSDFIGLPLKFAKGRWFIRQSKEEETEVGPTEPFVVDVRSYTTCWIKWQNRKPERKYGGRHVDGWISPPRQALPDQDQSQWPIGAKGREDPWRETRMLLLR